MKRGPHHYELAHYALRQICAEDPRWFFEIMGSGQQRGLLDDIWRQVRTNCDDDGAAGFDISEVGVASCRIKGFPALVITMPPPGAVAEAHFVAIVLKGDPKAEASAEQLDFAYLTLEKGIRASGGERTVMCAWTVDGAHLNYGDGPAVDREAFVAAVEGLL
jgi:hypothetical protein